MIVKSWVRQKAESRGQKDFSFIRKSALSESDLVLGFTPAPQDRYKWSSQHHIMNITGNKFYDWKQIKGGGGAIDLVGAGIGRNVI